MALMEACLTVLHGRDEVPGETPVYRPTITDVFRITEAQLRMRALVAAMTAPRPLDAFWPEVPKQKRGEPVVVRALDVRRGAGNCAGGGHQVQDFGAI